MTSRPINTMDEPQEQRQHRVLGNGPRVAPRTFDELPDDFIDMIRLFENVNNAIEADDDKLRDTTFKMRRQILSDPHSEASVALANQLPEIMRTVAHLPGLYAAHSGVGLHLLKAGTLSIRERELGILRIAWLVQAPYEWGEHILVARRAGFTDEDITAVIAGPTEKSLGKHETTILQGVDELYNDAMISDDTWNTLSESWSTQQLMEFPVLIGQYQAVAYYQNSLRLRLHKGNEGLKAR